MSAIRLARAYTKRKYIVKFEGCYHGHADALLVKAGSGVAGALASGLLLAGGWIRGLRRQVEQRTKELQAEVELHKQTEGQLAENTGQLAREIEERKQIQADLLDKKTCLEREIEERKRAQSEVERTHRQLLDASRQAGMAEVATSVLHNVGNVLNSVNVSAGIVAGQLKNSKVHNVRRVAALLREHQANLAEFVAQDAKGKQLPEYLTMLSEHLGNEQGSVLGELESLCKNIDHIKEIVAMQQSYAKVAGITEQVNPADLAEDALRMNTGALARHQVKVLREYSPGLPLLTVDKNKVLQILINLIRNAKYACDESGLPGKQITLRLERIDQRMRFIVADNGIGIPPENLTRIFNQGFTTRKNGHGFGLHSGALAASELGGSLRVHSDGPARGASFTLELPFAPAS